MTDVQAMTDALKDEFPDPETELAFLDFLVTEWPNWRHHVGSDYWHIRRRSFLAGRPAPRALAVTPAFRGERDLIQKWQKKLVELDELIETLAATPAVGGEDLDAARYRRLRVLGCAPGESKQLEGGTVLRFTGLDAYIDADISDHPSRGEAQSAIDPVAWLVLSEETGNTRIWWRDEERAKAWATKHNMPLIPLYAAQPASPLRGRETALQKALEYITQRANQYGTDESSALDIVYELDRIARAALSSASPPEQPEYLSGCLHPGTEPNSCQYEGQCLSAACNHNGKTTFRPRMTLEAQTPGILYPKKETT